MTDIGNYAFIGAQSVESVTIGNSVASIGIGAINHCDLMTTVTLPASVNTIGYAAFENCQALTTIYINSTGAISLTGSNNNHFNAPNLQYIAFSTPAGVLANTTGNWTYYTEKIRASLGSQFFLATNEGGTPAYQIATATDWNNLATAINGGAQGSGQTFRQTANITANSNFTPIGTSEANSFRGTYDGGSKTLTVNCTAANNYVAPFGNLYGTQTAHASVKNLNVVTTIYATDYRHIAGLIAVHTGYVDVTNCNANVTLSATKGNNNTDLYPAGLVSQVGSTGVLTISGCTTTGTIATNGMKAGGMVGIVQGTATITNSVSSVTINSSTAGDGTHGGFVGVASSGSTTITGCLFNGKLLTKGTTATGNCGGFVGWRGSTLTISNSLYAPAELGSGENEVGAGSGDYPSCTFARNLSGTPTNSYYTRTLGTAQGKQPHTATAGQYVTTCTVSPKGNATATYNISGITAYNNGISRSGTFYYGNQDQVNLTLSNATVTGYHLTSYTATNGGTITGTNNPFTLTMPDANVTVSATMTPNTYYVQFDGNGNTGGSMSDQTFTYDVAQNLTANDFTRTGYHFIGWNTQANGGGTSYTDGQSVSNLTATNNGTVTLYAQWTANTYIVQFDGNGNTGGSMSDQTFTYDEAQNLTANAYTRTGYTFAGWNTQANGSGDSYTDGQEVSNLTDQGTVTLYAQWTPNTYTVHFDGNGNTGGSMSDQSFTYGVAQNLSANSYTRTNYAFTGWNTQANGSGTGYDDEQSVINLTESGTVTLYAQWEYMAVSYLDANGVQQQCTDYTLLTGTITNTGFAAGWYVAEGNVSFNNTIQVNGDAHLILKDGAVVHVGTEENPISTYGILANGHSLSIYAQSTGDNKGQLHVYSSQYGITAGGASVNINGGEVTATGTLHGIYAGDNGAVTINGGEVTATGNGNDGNGIYTSSSGAVTINGGHVTATGTQTGIYAYQGTVTISGGEVTATGTTNYGIYVKNNSVTISGGEVTTTGGFCGIRTNNGPVTINGGHVTANGVYGFYVENNSVTINGGQVSATGSVLGIRVDGGSLSLGWTNASDSIYASSYMGTVNIAEGKAFTSDVTDIYSGTYTGDGVSVLAGKTLQPAVAVTLNNGITAVSGILTAGDNHYAMIGQTVTIGTETPAGYTLGSGITVTPDTVEVADNGDGTYSFTMPAEDVTVSANLNVIDWATESTGDAENPYMIYNKEQLNLLAQRVNSGEEYNGSYFQLGADITYPHTSDWNDLTSTEDNYTAIGGYHEGNRFFCGHFDGDGHTISGIRIYKGDKDHQGLFGWVSEADIHDLTLADARITGGAETGGIVGANSLGTIARCHVASNVAIHADHDWAGFHGGIAGYNNSTLSHCTSAVTLTIADNATDCSYYGAIVGGTYYESTIEDNLAIGATVLAAPGNFYGAICGQNDGALARNYYYNCTVAGVQNATNVGYSYYDHENNTIVNADVTELTINDVTYYDGAVSIHTLTLGDNLTTSTDATVTYNETDYYKNGLPITVSVTTPTGYTFNGITVIPATVEVTDNGDGTYSFTMPAEDVTVSANLNLIDWATESTGDAENPYMIYNKEQLNLLAYRVNGTNGETQQSDGYQGKYFKLGADIIYPHTTAWNDATSTESNYEAIGGDNGNSRFHGHFDGDGHTVSGIRIRISPYEWDYNNNQGLFGAIEDAEIHDLTLADARIIGYDYAGGIVGYSKNSTIARCHVTIDVAIHADEEYTCFHGGIAGKIENGTIDHCTSAATLTIPDNSTYCSYFGAIAGYNDVGTLEDNLAIGATVPATNNNSHGAICGQNDGALARNYYYNCTVAGVQNATGVGCYNADVTNNDGAVSIHTLTLGDNLTTSTDTTVTYNETDYYKNGLPITVSVTTPTGYTFNGITVTPATVEVADNGDGTYSFTMPAEDVTVSANIVSIEWSGSGTPDDPYIIMYPSQLDLLAYRVNGTHGYPAETDGFSGKYFKLNNDIVYTYTTAWNDATSTENNYEAIGGYYDNTMHYFKGHFDGDNKTVSGIRINNSSNRSKLGLFGLTYSTDIHDLTLADTRFTGMDDIGGIVGRADDNSTISHCTSTATVAIHSTGQARCHGGIVGWNRIGSTIDHCTSAVTHTIPNNAEFCQEYGGIVGINDKGTISHCISTATLTIHNGATPCTKYGGIVGGNKGTLNDNLVIGATIPATPDNSHGAICGYNSSSNTTLERNYYYNCTVAGEQNATGVGCYNADITDNDGAVSIHTLTLGDNLTTTTAATISYNETDYYKGGLTVTIGVTAPEGYAVSGIIVTPATGDAPAVTDNGNGTYSFTMPAADVTVSATFELQPVTYIDANGVEQQCTDYTVITCDEWGSITPSALTAGQWYVVKNDMEIHDDEGINVTGNGAANIILCDGKTLNYLSFMGNINGSLNIYGQSEGTGSFYSDNNNYYWSDKSYIIEGNLTIYGGQVTLIGHTGGGGESGYGVSQRAIYGDVTLYRGSLYAKGGDADYDDGYDAIWGKVYFYGGSLTAIGGEGKYNDFEGGNQGNDGYGISGNVSLSWTNVTDRFYADKLGCTIVTIAQGKAFTDGNGNVFSGTVAPASINGKTLQPYIDWTGSGSEDDPYMIYNKEQLNLLAYRVNGTNGETQQSDGYEGKYFKLGADIIYSHTTDWNDATSIENNYEAIGGDIGESTFFRGHFDGNGHTISGIRIYKDGTAYGDDCQGIFGWVKGADIHDLTLADARITGHQETGGIVGFNEGGSVTRCHVASTVTIHAVTGCSWHGGIAGSNDNYGSVTHCTSAATLTIASGIYCSHYGGICGANSRGTLEDNLAIGATVPAANDNYHGAICGFNDDEVLSRNYYYNCTVAGVQNATNVGCRNADVTELTISDYDNDVTYTYYDGAVYAVIRMVEGYGESTASDHWTFISSPLTDNIEPDEVINLETEEEENYDFYRLNNTTWENIKATTSTNHSDFTTLVNGQGYLYANKNDVGLVFKGTYNSDNTKSVELKREWNLVGNPFDAPATVNMSYFRMNATGTAIEPVDITQNTAPIDVCTGIVVKQPEGAKMYPIITFTRVTTPQNATNNNGGLQITLAQTVTTRGGSSTETLDNAIVSFNEGSQLGKFYFGTQNANIYLPQDGKEYAIVSVGGRDGVHTVSTMDVNFKANENGEYTITVNPEGVEMIYLHLIDNMTGADVDLLSGGDRGSESAMRTGGVSYTFTAKTTDYESRFRLVFVCGDANDDNDGDNETFAYYFNGSWIIANEGQATLQVIDLNGRILSSETVNGSVSKSISQPAGVYMIRLINGEDVMVQKIVVR